MADDWNGFSVLHTAASRVGGARPRLRAGEGRGRSSARSLSGAAKLDLLFLLGVDEVAVPDGAFVVYLGTHGDQGAHRADVILPGAAYTEKSGTYVNTEGRVQMGNRAAFPPGDAREDWSILRALSGVLGKTLPFDSLAQLRAQLYQAHPHFAAVDEILSRRARRHRAPRGARRRDWRRGLREPDPRFLSDQPDRARLAGACRMLGDASRPGGGGGRIRWASSSATI